MKKTLFLILSIALIEGNENYVFQYSENDKILPADEVFIVTQKKENDILYINWDIKENYYLYLDSIVLKEDQKVVNFYIEDGDISNYEDEIFGETKIIKNFLNISFSNASKKTKVKVFYQGCSEKGFCYPVKSINIL
tara:strand:+ start:359 stop:769 length:411 start_codon:yes stop_codon:yes gene_type:complete